MTVLIGFLDGQGRAYDLSFRTLKRRVRDAEGAWTMEPGESFGGDASLEMTMFLQTERTHLLMRPTRGTLRASAQRFLFLAGDAVARTPEEPTAFHVAIHVPPTAVDHLFREESGREIVEVRREEVRAVTESRAELTLRVEAPWVGGGNEPVTFQVVLAPNRTARAALAPLGL